MSSIPPLEAFLSYWIKILLQTPQYFKFENLKKILEKGYTIT